MLIQIRLSIIYYNNIFIYLFVYMGFHVCFHIKPFAIIVIIINNIITCCSEPKMNFNTIKCQTLSDDLNSLYIDILSLLENLKPI